MIDFLKNWVLNVVTLVVFIMLIEMLIPSGKTKKIVNLVTGFILVIGLINPLLKLVGSGIALGEFQMAGSNYIDKKEVMINSEVLEEKQIRQITNVYREKIIAQLKSITQNIEGIKDAKADIIINEDYTSERFGEVKKVYLYLSLEDEDEGIKRVLSVKKVEIDLGQSEDIEQQHEKQLDEKIRFELEDKVARLLNVQKEDIVISLEED
ncbi:stage III sporulation protein AF [Acetivibrio mesophilus]|uniref:Stage III sporulation protein AF n=1 Tax=Acetivibrio mesophilus TaxID=2487273 RepID=A0A4V1K2B2_9FIRM|nr:stage III sporulation protein AF [Acetivibrio mesophilus]ODM25301.1 stage III sporulation protein AF [Clostridium sp. Bc-iso-3]RXE59679.1 stage III sporulation protein AF [Acetivibrio mesophilus]HHV28600.1 stage III sporulation protein AF [Clostridium sp.]